jgi:hypothetical protein
MGDQRPPGSGPLVDIVFNGSLVFRTVKAEPVGSKFQFRGNATCAGTTSHVVPFWFTGSDIPLAFAFGENCADWVPVAGHLYLEYFL